MLRRALATGLLIAAFTLNAFPGFLRKSDFVPASFDGYEVTLADGVTIDIGVAGGRILLNSDVNRDYEIILSKCKTTMVVRKFSYAGGSYDIDIASFMNEGELYYVEIEYEAFGRTVSNGNNIIFKSGNNIHFWKSGSYEYNLDKCSEMWTDEQSLRECLEPQNDIECDDPVLIGYSERICEGAKDDWEKVFRIYSYIVNGMAYDNVEADGRSGGYQDSAVDVIETANPYAKALEMLLQLFAELRVSLHVSNSEWAIAVMRK